MSREPLEHLERPPLPWRAERVTECRLPVESFPCLTREEFSAKFRRLGQQRAAMTTCMNCWHTAGRWSTWDENPVDRIQRETYGGRADEDGTFRLELLAIAALVEAHREEFDSLLAGLGSVTRLTKKRRLG